MKTCKERFTSHKKSRISDLKKLWKAYCEGEESRYYKKVFEEIGEFHDYGLCFDYVAPGTFEGENEGYWRYQLSCGGPSEEFRFYASSPSSDPYKIEFTLLDWFDGETRILKGSDLELMTEIWGFFVEIGSTESTFEESMTAEYYE